MRQFVTSVSSEPWSKAQIEALLARENYSYQKIALPHGLTTPGKDRLSITHKFRPPLSDAVPAYS